MKRFFFTSIVVSFVLLAPSIAPAQLSRLVLLDDLEKEEGVVEISSPQSRLGRDLGRAGDVDGDGLDDILVGASDKSQVLLIYGQPGLPAKLDPLLGGARMSVIVSEAFATTMVDLGGGLDVNGDGLDDFFVGEKTVTTVVFGSRSLPARFALADVGDRVPGLRIEFPRTEVRFTGVFRQNVSLGADMNGDGIAEILLGDPAWAPGEPGKGLVRVIFGGERLPAMIQLEDVGGSVPGFVVAGTVPDLNGPSGDGIGICVQGVGDVDGDGFGDLGIAGNSCFKGSYLVFGRAQFPAVIEVDQIAGGYGVYFESMSGCMRPLGDLDGDGRADFTLQYGGQPEEWVPNPDPELKNRYDLLLVAGRSRRDFGFLVSAEKLHDDPRNTVIRGTWSVCPALLPVAGGIDVDKDGRGDLLFARQDGVQLPDDAKYGGVVYYLPVSADLPRRLSLRDLQAGWGAVILGKDDDDLGNGIQGTTDFVLEQRNNVIELLSDFDGDGSGDLLLGAPHVRGTETSRTRTYMVPVRALLDPALEVTGISPPAGHSRGGDLVRVTGRGFAPGTRFFFGNAAAEIASAELQSTALLRVPAWQGGSMTVDLTARRGGRSSVLPLAFRYYQGPILDVEDIAAGTVPGGELYTRLQFHYGDLSGPVGIESFDIVRDVNGDGIDDIAIRWEREVGWTGSVIFGGPHLAGRTDFFDTPHGITLPFQLDLRDSESVGEFIGSGDVDGDGIGDLTVWTFSGTSSWLHIVYGGPDLPTQTHPAAFPRRTRISGFDGYNPNRIVEDIDGGGKADLVLTAYDSTAGANFGFWILRGEDLYMLHDVDWGSVPKHLIRTRFARIDTYQSLDANGDGLADLAFQAKAGAREGLLVLFGGSHFAGAPEILVDDAFLDGGRKGVAIAGRAYAYEWPSMGFVLSRSGDLNGDGADELVVGSPFITGTVDGNGLDESGEAYVISTRPGLAPPPDSDYAREWARTFAVTPVFLPDPAAPARGVLTLEGVSARRRLGYAVAGAGDLNGDAFPDIAVGEGISVPSDCVNCGPSLGTGLPYTYVLFGGVGTLEGRNHPLTPEDFAPGVIIRGAGLHLVGGHDVNGDGLPDLLMSRSYGSVYVLFGGPDLGEIRFRRGDVDLNGRLEISDAVRLLGFLFLGDSRPRCLAACDTDDDGKLDISDAVRILGYLFLGGPAPRAPFPEPGTDPTPDDLGCGER